MSHFKGWECSASFQSAKQRLETFACAACHQADRWHKRLAAFLLNALCCAALCRSRQEVRGEKKAALKRKAAAELDVAELRERISSASQAQVGAALLVGWWTCA